MRAASLVRSIGGFGLIATNTVAQGDTREVGLDPLPDRGLTIHRAVSSEPWPGGAHLEMATVWASRREWAGVVTLDGLRVAGITPALVPRSRVEGAAKRLHTASGMSFKGSGLMGMGFVLSRDEADRLIADDARNAQVIRPYLNGDDLNQRPDGSPSRWVIDFRDWPEAKAREFAGPFERVERLVRPERAKNVERRRREIWWRFDRPVTDLYRSIHGFERCIAITRHSKAVQPMFVPGGIVMSEALVAFAFDDDAHFGLLSSGFHSLWAVANASTMRTDIRYTPTDCFETFVRPELSLTIGRIGGELNTCRSASMLDRSEGLTTTYNRVHDPDEHSDDIVRLREIHVGLDYAVRDAYGWTDLDLGHDFHATKFGTRYTFAPLPRQEVLDRLLELNHERYAEEVRQGLHGKPKSKGKRKVATPGAMTFGLDDV